MITYTSPYSIPKNQRWIAKIERMARSNEFKDRPEPHYFKNVVCPLLLMALVIILIGGWSYWIIKVHFKRNGYINKETRMKTGSGIVLSSHKVVPDESKS